MAAFWVWRVKSPTGLLRLEQACILERLKDAGYVALIAREWSAVLQEVICAGVWR